MNVRALVSFPPTYSHEERGTPALFLSACIAAASLFFRALACALLRDSQLCIGPAAGLPHAGRARRRGIGTRLDWQVEGGAEEAQRDRERRRAERAPAWCRRLQGAAGCW